MRKTSALRMMLNSTELDFICEAHNAISAKIVEEAGFNGIWASGLTISASMGVRDSNEASWTQVMEVLEFMSDVTTIPILLDGDTGYGNFNNMQRLVKKLELRGIAGVCIEDKVFPKTNSFIDGEKQELTDIDEFCGKIKAGKDIQKDEDFSIIARVEAFIAGWGLREAIHRAEAYRLAGADAILVHSKKSNPSDIEAFMKEWGNRHPVVIVPTKYYSTPTSRFEDLGISLVIWANHLMRASIRTMQDIAKDIHETRSLVNVEDRIANITEIFRLQGAKELQEAEMKYLPTKGKKYTAVVLAASRGDELSGITKDRPKAMLEVNRSPILFTSIDIFNSLGIKDVVVVRGYKKEIITGTNFKTVDNDEYEGTRDLFSLYCARQYLTGSCIISYGDCLYKKHLISDVIDHGGNIRIVVDADASQKQKPRDLVRCSAPYTNDFLVRDIHLTSVEAVVGAETADGEWTGLLVTETEGTALLRGILDDMSRRDDFKKLSVTDLLGELVKKSSVTVVYTKGGWIDVDDLVDFIEAGGF